MTDAHRYSGIDKILHWLFALNVMATLLFAAGLSDLSLEEKKSEYIVHALSVTTIALLLIIRSVWRAVKGTPTFTPEVSLIEQCLAKIVHRLLYVVFYLQIAIGVLLASTTQTDFHSPFYGINYTQFNLLPDYYYDPLLLIHQSIYWLIALLVIGHLLAALKHHFIDKNSSLLSMLPFLK